MRQAIAPLLVAVILPVVILAALPRRAGVPPEPTAALGPGVDASTESGATDGGVAKAAPWQTLEPGLELAIFASPTRSIVGDSKLHVLRVDPARFDLRLISASAGDRKPRTARAWAKERGLVAAINAAMYHDDNLTSTHLMVTRGHVNNGHLAATARAILAFDRKDDGVPPVQIIDRDCQDFSSLRPRYHTLVQSIRMVSCKRANVWAQQPKQWSHAAIGVDGKGRVLFVHTRSPFATHDLIDTLLALPIDLQQLQYSEGGPETQLYVKAGSLELERVGSYETGFFESDQNASAWPIPNIVGVVRRPAPRVKP